jgi:hypothetical protein
MSKNAVPSPHKLLTALICKRIWSSAGSYAPAPVLPVALALIVASVAVGEDDCKNSRRR